MVCCSLHWQCEVLDAAVMVGLCCERVVKVCDLLKIYAGCINIYVGCILRWPYCVESCHSSAFSLLPWIVYLRPSGNLQHYLSYQHGF